LYLCRRRRRPRASFSFLIASFGSFDPLPTRVPKVSLGENLCSPERAAATHTRRYFVGGAALESLSLAVQRVCGCRVLWLRGPGGGCRSGGSGRWNCAEAAALGCVAAMAL